MKRKVEYVFMDFSGNEIDIQVMIFVLLWMKKWA